LLVLHTGIICFTDWPEWPQYLGGSWNWGSSWHPAVEVFAARWASTLREPQQHPIVHDLGEIVVEDERYCELGVGPQAQVLLESDGPEGIQASMWTHEQGSARTTTDRSIICNMAASCAAASRGLGNIPTPLYERCNKQLPFTRLLQQGELNVVSWSTCPS
jgi:hypothetical protein